jgi:hypothetical protein
MSKIKRRECGMNFFIRMAGMDIVSFAQFRLIIPRSRLQGHDNDKKPMQGMMMRYSWKCNRA